MSPASGAGRHGRTAGRPDGPDDGPDRNAEAERMMARALERLDQGIRTLRIEQQRFLAGDLKLPPVELRDRLREQLRALRARAKGVPERFRLNTLEAQLNSHLDLFGRRQQEQLRSAPTATGAKPKPDPEAGVVIGGGGHGAAEEALYQGLYLRQGQRRPPVDLERFRAQLHRNAEIIRAKTGCREILFRVAVENGKLKLKAKPIRPPS